MRTTAGVGLPWDRYAVDRSANALSRDVRDKMAVEVKTTGVAGGLHRPYKGLGQPRLKALERFANRIAITGCPLPGAAFLLALAYWLTRKRVCILFETDLVRGYVLL